MTDELMADLRARFRDASKPRVAQMYTLIATLEQNTSDREALHALERHFHALSGMGGTYGFPRISECADEAEGALLRLRRSGESPTVSELAVWRGLLADIDSELC